MNYKTYPYWLAVEESKTVRFSDLAHMMAKAMHPGDHELESYAAARINLEGELKQAVRDGLLTPRNAAGLGRHTFPHGDALQRAVFFPRQDLEPFLNDRGIELRLTPHGSGPEYWTLENAAAVLQKQLNWHDGARGEFQDQMREAATTGTLVVLDPHTCLPTRSTQVHTYWELVTPENVNAWLESLGAPYRWNLVKPDAEWQQKSRRESKPWETLFPIYEPLEGLYMLVQAAREIADAEGWSDTKWRELEATMRQAVWDCKLPTRSRHTGMKQPSDPKDFLLLVTVEDVNEWLKAEGVPYRWRVTPPKVEPEPKEDASPWPQVMHGQRVWRLSKAIDEIARALNWHQSQRDRLMAQAIKDGTAGVLVLRDLFAGGIAKRGDHMSELLDYVFSKDMNGWLDLIDAPFAYRLPEAESEQEPEATVPLTVAQSPGNTPLPPPVATGDVAHAFDGLRKWNEKAWKDNLGSPAKWLEACIALRGQRGIREHHWNPVLIGAALVRDGHAKPNNIRARFQTKRQLEDWEEAWKTYEAENFDT